MSYENMTVEPRGAADWVTLNRPEQMNALTDAFVHELNDYFDCLAITPVIELSAQRAAVALQTGEPVADHAYVAVRRPGSAAPRIHRVRLMSIVAVEALAARRETILLGRLAPGYAGSAEICRRCAFVSGCEKFKDGGLRKHET